FWFIGALGPHANVIATQFWMQDRYIYLAMPGLLLATAVAAKDICERLKFPALACFLGVGLPVLVVALTWNRSALYGNATELLLNAVERQPMSAMARRCAAHIYNKQFQLHSRTGAKPDEELEQLYLDETVKQYQGALLCPDVENFFEIFYLRVSLAELLVRQ